jgi:hypothetical protein
VQVGNNKRYFFVIRLRANMLGGGEEGGMSATFKVFHTPRKMATVRAIVVTLCPVAILHETSGSDPAAGDFCHV